MGIDSGTLQGYDIVLSISDEAIRKQLENLYDTPITRPVPNGPKHLIDHELHMRKMIVDEDEHGQTITKPSKYGLNAYVCCPKILLNPYGKTDPDKTHIARMAFKFRQGTEDEAATNQVKDSQFTYKVGEESGRFKSLVMNDWEISWEGSVRAQEMTDVMKELVDPAKSDTNPAALKDSVVATLERVKAKTFKVSTIFCALERGQMASTLKIVDEKGADRTKDPILSDFVTLFILNLSNKSPGPSGDPKALTGNTNNLFILGYTIAESTPSVERYNPAAAASSKPTPPVFIPKSFACTLTGPGGETGNTLNFCMLTNRWKGPPKFESDDGGHSITDTDRQLAGVFSKTFFAELGITPAAGSADATLTFAQDVIVNHWIGGYLAPSFRLDPETIGKSLTDKVKEIYDRKSTYSEWKPTADNAFGPFTVDRKAEIYSGSEYKWSMSTGPSKRVYIGFQAYGPTWKHWFRPQQGLEVFIDQEVVIKYENKESNPTELSKRQLKFTIGSYIGYSLRGSYFNGGADKRRDENDPTEWSVLFDTRIWQNCEWVFTFRTSNVNRGSFDVTLDESRHMKDSNFVTYEGEPPGNERHKPGLWQPKPSNWVEDTWNWGSQKTIAKNIGLGYVKDAAAKMENAAKDMASSLNSTMIMPAGDVFLFNGVSTFGKGEIAAIVNYDTSLSGKVQSRPAPNWSFARSWLVPKAP